MFICHKCKLSKGLNESPTKVILETRPRQYENKFKVQVGDRKIDKYKTSVGSEIVREVNYCKDCLPKETNNVG